ncbi:MAG: hypothetical protein SGJ20_16455, partial [Planctomycetota bacterium]|nr:hypothetical protein [Planctomycetota bacterium]
TYVGRRGISKYGCSGCHDIPGFEDAKPIGTSLADWGRKDPARLAFENVAQYLEHGHGSLSPHGDHKHSDPKHNGHATGDAATKTAGDGQPVAGAATTEDTTSEELAVGAMVAPKAEGQEVSADYGLLAPENEQPSEADLLQDEEFFLEKIKSHEREGFIWQKLHQPRAFDYKKVVLTEAKRYNDRLRMPKFSFSQDRAGNEQAIEAIMTFVLGLVTEPPTSQYLFKPSPRDSAIIEGRKVLEKYNCGGCHVLEMDRWVIEYEPGWTSELEPNKFQGVSQEKDGKEIIGPPDFDDYAFLKPHFTPHQIDVSLNTNRRGRRTATLVGAPVRNPVTGKIAGYDEEGLPIEADDTTTPASIFEFTLYDPVLINGDPVAVGSKDLQIQKSMLASRSPGSTVPRVYPAWGGDLARWLYPVVIADENVSTDSAPQAWQYLPPTLAQEGRKVQTNWVYDFLLDPHLIRPAVVLRMPKFNMSPKEAQALANYFAAADNQNYPYEFDPRTQRSYLEQAAVGHPDRLKDGMGIVTSLCVKCHLVGEFNPGGNPRALAPQLDGVYERLRPDYVHGWVASPKRFLPYTTMPANIIHNLPLSQELFPGDSIQQLNGVVDLLMNYTRFVNEQFKVQPLIQTPPADGAATDPAAPGAATPPIATPPPTGPASP